MVAGKTDAILEIGCGSDVKLIDIDYQFHLQLPRNTHKKNLSLTCLNFIFNVYNLYLYRGSMSVLPN